MTRFTPHYPRHLSLEFIHGTEINVYTVTSLIIKMISDPQLLIVKQVRFIILLKFKIGKSLIVEAMAVLISLLAYMPSNIQCV